MEKISQNRPGILVVGGYGHVGQQIARRLTDDSRFDVRIAGRNKTKAKAVAANLRCDAEQIDLGKPESWNAALAGITIVIVCMDQADTRFVEYVLNRGLTLIDITADDMFFQKVEQLQSTTKAHGGRALLSVGLAPGLTNLMVKACAEKLDSVSQARIGILLGIGDSHGPAAIDWTLRNFKSARIENLPFDRDGRNYPAIPFDFADQHVLRRTLGIGDVRTLMTFDSPAMSRLLFLLLPLVASRPRLRDLTRNCMMRFRLGSDRAALYVAVEGTRNGIGFQRSIRLEGRQEAAITALMAAETARLLVDTSIPAGIWHIDQVFSIERYAHHLAAEGVFVTEIDEQLTRR